MARLYKRGKTWWAWGYYADGERWSESTRCHDRRAAERKAVELERERATVDRAATAPLPLERALKDVIAAREREEKADATIACYRRHGGHLCRVLGPETDVHELTLASLEGYIDKRREEGAMRSTVDKELCTLRTTLRYAAKHQRFRGNPRSIHPGEALSGAYVPHDRYLTHAEYVMLRDALPNRRGEYLAAYVFTGARRTEIWQVRRADISLEHGTLRIRGTKTTGADRIVPIAAELRPIIERRLAECGDGPLFPKWTEWTTLDRACKRVGIGGVSPNDLRRTFCSWLAAAGTPLLVTVRLMGHTTAKMVTRVYARFSTDDLRAGIERLPDLSQIRSGAPAAARDKPHEMHASQPGATEESGPEPG